MKKQEPIIDLLQEQIAKNQDHLIMSMNEAMFGDVKPAPKLSWFTRARRAIQEIQDRIDTVWEVLCGRHHCDY